MGIGNVLDRTFPQSTVRHSCPVENGAGDGLFFAFRENKNFIQTYKAEKRSFWRIACKHCRFISRKGKRKIHRMYFLY